MEKTTLSVLAFCITAGGIAHAQEMVDLKNLKVLEENRISVEEYHPLAEQYPGVKHDLDDGNYDTFNSNVTSGNYDTFNSNITSGNYDTFNSNITSGNYDTFNSNIDSGNYSSLDPSSTAELVKNLDKMPAPQANK